MKWNPLARVGQIQYDLHASVIQKRLLSWLRFVLMRIYSFPPFCMQTWALLRSGAISLYRQQVAVLWRTLWLSWRVMGPENYKLDALVCLNIRWRSLGGCWNGFMVSWAVQPHSQNSSDSIDVWNVSVSIKKYMYILYVALEVEVEWRYFFMHMHYCTKNCL